MTAIETLKQVLRTYPTQRIVLFTGAGFNFGSTNSDSKPIPLGSGLRNELLNAAGVTGEQAELTLDAAAQFAKKRLGAQRVLGMLESLFKISDPTPSMRSITSRKWLRAYTTNFDNGFEACFRLSGKSLTTLTFDDDIGRLSPVGQNYIHLNGSIERVDFTNLDKSVRLSRSTYVKDSPQRKIWASQVSADFEACAARIFVGYSLADPDITALIPSDETAKQKTFFVTSPTPNEIEDSFLQDYGQVVRIGEEKFAELLTESASVVNDPAIDQTRLISDAAVINLKEYSSDAPGVEDIFRFIWTGRIDRKFVGNSGSTARYAIDRTGWSWEQNDPRTHGRQLLVVKGNLGTGKSVLLEQIAARATKAGVDAAFLTTAQQARLRQFDAIVKLKTPFVLLVDGYGGALDFLTTTVAPRAHDQMLVVVAERSALHEFVIGRRLSVAFSGWKTSEVDLETMSRQEVSELTKYLGMSGLIGDLGHLSQTQIEGKIQHEFESYLPNVLLSAVDSPEIRSRLESAAEFLKRQTTGSKHYLMIMVLQSMGVTPTKTLLDDLVGQTMPMSDQDHASTGELFGSAQGRMYCVSTVFGQYILSNVVESAFCIDTINEALDNAIELRRVNDNCEHFADLLVRTNTIQKIFRTQKSLQHAQAIFDYARNQPYFSGKALFWLQYAIWAYVCENWDLADQLFTTSYAKGRATPGFDPFQIDNHYARFRVTRALAQEVTNPSQAEAELRAALNTILEQTGRSENEHFPYRVASTFKAYYDRYHEMFSDDFRRYVLTSSELILKRASGLASSLRMHDDVMKCEKNLRKLLERHRSAT
jgi:hypothetical protein